MSGKTPWAPFVYINELLTMLPAFTVVDPEFLRFHRRTDITCPLPLQRRELRL
jgi:hypothetical protein